LPEVWKGSVILPICKKGDKRDGINYKGILFCQLRTKVHPIFCCQD